MGEEGCAYIAESLAFNDSCQSLDLGGNKIGPLGTQSLCIALKSNTALSTLSMSGNKCGSTHRSVPPPSLPVASGRFRATCPPCCRLRQFFPFSVGRCRAHGADSYHCKHTITAASISHIDRD